MPREYQKDFESFCDEDHYYDRLANLQMADYSYKENPIDGISIAPGSENNERRLNEMFGIT